KCDRGPQQWRDERARRPATTRDATDSVLETRPSLDERQQRLRSDRPPAVHENEQFAIPARIGRCAKYTAIAVHLDRKTQSSEHRPERNIPRLQDEQQQRADECLRIAGDGVLALVRKNDPALCRGKLEHPTRHNDRWTRQAKERRPDVIGNRDLNSIERASLE